MLAQRVGIDGGKRANTLSDGGVAVAVAVAGSWRLVAAVSWCHAHESRFEG